MVRVPHLLDVNVLIALAWPNHVHHAPAHHWFASESQSGWATCPITECGFVRISANAKAIVGAVSPRAAADLLDRIVGLPNHVFWPDDLAWTERPGVPRDGLVGHRQVTDAYLVGLATKHGGKLATLDRRVPSLFATDAEAAAAVTVITD